MKVVVSVVSFAIAIGACTAHLCLVSPQQRGSITGLDKPASNDCLLLTNPCGGRPAESAISNYMPMSNITVIFQKNLDHWVKATPGYFSVNLWKGSMKVKELARIPDMGEPSLTLYTAMGKLPADKGSYILQVEYATMNSQAPPMFYQCADIMIN